MDVRIRDSLGELLERHRIVFWYDADGEMRREFEALDLPDVTGIELDGNEFAVRRRILREDADGRFLLYHAGPRPADAENWLLDVLLAHGVFRADRTGLVLSGLGLDAACAPAVEEHPDFFRDDARCGALKALLAPGDGPDDLLLKMLAVCAGSGPRPEDILTALLEEHAAGGTRRISLVEACGLSPVLWREAEAVCGFEAASLGDLVSGLFASVLPRARDAGGTPADDGAVRFLRAWKDGRTTAESFRTLSDACADELDAAGAADRTDWRHLTEDDWFRCVDQKIAASLAREIRAGTVGPDEVERVVAARRRSVWHGTENMADIYGALLAASRLLAAFAALDPAMSSARDGAEKYAASWFRLDQLYRVFTMHRHAAAGATTLLKDLKDAVEGRYVNGFLKKLGDLFQETADGLKEWRIPGIRRQDAFFEECVRPFLKGRRKICVVVSDALRYEVADELLGALRRVDRVEADLECMHTLLPSVTSLGMAALLPHGELSFSADGGDVLSDGRSTAGLENRSRMLAEALDGRGTAFQAEDVLGMEVGRLRERVRENDVIYVYHNRIDVTGDNRTAEGDVCRAVHETVDELEKLVRKLVSGNISNFLITADHGFLHQDGPLEEGDRATGGITGREIVRQKTRYALGRGLEAGPGLQLLSSAATGLSGDMEILVARSLIRLPRQGAGVRYVHGGATLQEIVVPILRVNKGRESDVSAVDVDILDGSASSITTGQLAVTFYQRQAVTDKIRPRTLRAGIRAADGALISDEHEIVMDCAGEHPRDRERKVRFILTREADRANGGDVTLLVEERVGGTNRWRSFAERRYALRRSFVSDFDF